MSKIGLGDFQTPVEFARKVWSDVNYASADVIIEPTVGEGAFITAAPSGTKEKAWRCFDIETGYVRQSRAAAKKKGIKDARVARKDIFKLANSDLRGLDRNSVVLAIGNPPWVTNATLGALEYKNLPQKLNSMHLSGMDAMTGKSNFDISEAIILHLLALLKDFRETRFAFLIKRSVAFKLAQELMGTPGVARCGMTSIDARKHWGVAVDACLFTFTYKKNTRATTRSFQVVDLEGSKKKVAIINSRFVYDSAHYDAALESTTPRTGKAWRQGVKHDAAPVLELRRDHGALLNGLGETTKIEEATLCPLYKSSDLANGRKNRYWFPFYQTSLKEVPNFKGTPKLKRYLQKHKAFFVKRKSSIYNNHYPFMLFGVGDYTEAKHKVAVSGLYKEPLFVALGPRKGRPPLLDDTCYFLPCGSAGEARNIALFLNSEPVQEFLASISDKQAKRPYTKAILQRIYVPATFTDELLGALRSGDAEQVRVWLRKNR